MLWFAFLFEGTGMLEFLGIRLLASISMLSDFSDSRLLDSRLSDSRLLDSRFSDSGLLRVVGLRVAGLWVAAVRSRVLVKMMSRIMLDS